jgi:hypothetical protein
MEISSFTIIKGALIPETYAAFQAWSFERSTDENFAQLRQDNSIGSASAHWLRDVTKVLHRRFDPSEHDRSLVELAQARCPMEVWKPILLWHMTRDEFLLRDFVVRWLAAEFQQGRYSIRTSDVLDYLGTLPCDHARAVAEWSDSTRKRVAAALLRILTDFGLLCGTTVRKFNSYHLPDESFLYLLHAIADTESNARKVVEAEDWRLFLMTPTDVENTLFRLHQFRRVHYEVAGSLAQLQLPCGSARAFAERIGA